MSKMKDCLGQAVSTILNAKELLPEDRERIAGSLQRFLDRDDLPDDQALQKLAFIMRDAKRDIYVSHVSKLGTERSAQRLAEAFDHLSGEKYAEAVREFTVPSADWKARETMSVEYKIRGTVEQASSRLHEIWNRAFSFAGNDQAFLLDFRRAQLGLDATAEARTLAETYREVTGELLERLRATGVYVGHIDNYMPRNWSYGKIRDNLQEFTRLMREHLDPAEHPDADATIDRMLYHIEHADLQDPTQTTISMARELRFTSPEGELEIMLRFAEDNFAAQLMHGVRMLAKRAVLAEEYGPNPRAAMAPVLKRAMHEAGQARAAASRSGDKRAMSRANRAVRDARTAQNMVDAHAGHLAHVHNQTLANWSGAARDLVTADSLGRVGLAQLTMDSFNTFMRSRFHTGGFASSVTRTLGHLVEVLGDARAKEFAQELGLFQHAFQMASAGRHQSAFAQGRPIRGFAAKAAAVTQRLSTSMFLENAFRSAMGLTVLRQMAKATKHNWGELPPRYRRLLENSGVKEAHWREIRQGEPNELGAMDLTTLSPKARESVMHFLWREVDTGVIHPDSYDRWLLLAGQPLGTVSGEVVAASTQFWSWTVGFTRKMVVQEWQMGKTGFTGFAAGTTLLAALTTQLYTVSAGQPAFEWDSVELWKRAFVRSGLFTPAGEMVLNAMGGRGVDAGGPVGSTVVRALRSGYVATERALDGEADRAAATLLRQARGIVVPNYWWSDAGVSYVFDQIGWELDPQYMRDRDRRWAREGRNL